MKWGVRRYQNPDGTLTEAGKKRYSDGNVAYKDLKRAVRNRRSEIHGKSNRWSTSPIGPNSDRLRKERDAKEKEYRNSKEYKTWLKNYDRLSKKLEKDFDEEKIDIKEYDRQMHKAFNQKPKQNFNTLAFAKSYGDSGAKYLDNYLTRGGKDLSIAYLKDLNFDTTDAEYLVEQMLESNRTLGDI